MPYCAGYAHTLPSGSPRIHCIHWVRSTVPTPSSRPAAHASLGVASRVERTRALVWANRGLVHGAEGKWSIACLTRAALWQKRACYIPVLRPVLTSVSIRLTAPAPDLSL